MIYVRIENDEIVETVQDLRRKFPHISFPRALPDTFREYTKVIDEGGAAGEVKSDIILTDGVPRQSYVISQDNIAAALKARRDARAAIYTYKGVPLNLSTAKAMTSLSTLYLLVIGSASIPDAQVMCVWQEPDHDDLSITAGDLRADGLAILTNYQSAWAAYSQIKAQRFNSIAEATAAFDAAMEA